MRPLFLRMKNFGPFSGDAELDFGRLEDIFLVTGKTGSGKTTVFDGICFALYGEVPGVRNKHVSRLRSDHAPPDAQCLVSLEFLSGGRRYLVERGPKQEKAKKRGEGVTVIEETAVLYEISDGKKINPTSKKSETDKKILDIIGLDAKDFSRVIMLPQGDFAQFLRQNSTERQEVLGRLFPVGEAARARELAAKKAGEAKAQSAEAARVFEEAGSRFSPETCEETLRGLEARRNRLKETAASLEEDEKKALEYLRVKREEAETAPRLEREKEKARRIGENQNHLLEIQKRLGDSKKAWPLKQYLVSRNEQKRNVALAEKTHQKALAENERAAAELVLARGLSGEMEMALALIRELAAGRPGLLDAKNGEGKIRETRKSLESAGVEKEKLETRKTSFAGELAQKDRLLREGEELVSQIPLLEKLWEESRLKKDAAAEIKKLAAEIEKRTAEKEKNRVILDDLAARTGELTERVPRLEAELKNLEAEKKERERNNMAGTLAAVLEAGKPCPVCGSPEHPRPARTPPVPFSFDQRMEALSGSLNDAVKDRAAAAANLLSREKEAGRLEEEIAGYSARAREINREAGLFDPDGALPQKEAVEKMEKQFRELFQERDKKLQERRKTQNGAGALHREKAAAQSRLSETEVALASLAEKGKALAAALEDMEEKNRAALGKILEVFEKNGLFGGETRPSGAEEALFFLDKKLAALEDRVQAIRERRENAGKAAAAAASVLEAGLEKLETGKKALLDAEAALKEATEASPFAGEAEIEAALLDQKTEDALSEELRLAGEEENKNRAIIAELEQRLQDIKTRLEKTGLDFSAEETEALLARLKTEREAAETERERVYSEISGLERGKKAYAEAKSRYEAVSLRAGKLKALADDLGGKNPKKIAFDSWLLGLYLREAAAFASKRLFRMSDFRYSLLLDTAAAGRGRQGLDLAVFDAATGKARPCATLSGGESFMASISLALGLADSIQSRSGGVRVEAVFIDEGFGSLDEAALDKALSILDELRDNRMVGLISHVPEMRTRIPCRVEIQKTAGGSKIAGDPGLP